MSPTLIRGAQEMGLEEQTRENTRNIATLASTVTELSTMFRYTEKSRDEERAYVKEAVTELKSLNDKMTSLSYVKGDLTALADKIRDHETRINEFESLRDKAEGASGAAKIFIHSVWAIVSAGGLSVVAWLVTNYEKLRGGSIGGE